MATVDHSLFGGFHIILTIVSVLAAVMAAWFAARFVPGSASSGGVVAGVDPKNSKRRLDMILLLTGMLLAMLETFKQIYLYFSSGSSAYDWWYFPFQLCSVPMYLCALVPFVTDIYGWLYIRQRSGRSCVSGGYTERCACHDSPWVHLALYPAVYKPAHIHDRHGRRVGRRARPGSVPLRSAFGRRSNYQYRGRACDANRPSCPQLRGYVLSESVSPVASANNQRHTKSRGYPRGPSALFDRYDSSRQPCHYSFRKNII